MVWAKWKHHVWAMAILAVTGLWTIMLPPGAVGPGGARPLIMPELTPGALGTRFFGYGALILIGLALAIGPLARLRPRWFARLIPYRRAVGVWSAIAGVVHLLFVLQYVQHSFDRRTWLTLFLHQYRGYDAANQLIIRWGLQFEPLTVVAWLGLIALAFLLLVALVSNDWSLKFLGQATWKLVQQWTYTAFLFVALHVLVMRYGGKLKGSPPLTRWALWVIGGVALLQMAGFLYTVWKRRASKGSGAAA